MFKLLLVTILILPNLSFAQKAKWVTVNESLFAKIGSLFKGKKTLKTLDGASLVEMNDQEIQKLGHSFHSKLNRCGGFMAHSSLNEANLALNSMESVTLGTKLKFTDYAIDQETLVTNAINEVEEVSIREMIEKLSSYETRHYKSASGLDAIEFIRSEWMSLIKNRSDISLEVFKHKEFPQPSLIVTIKGSTIPDEIVILGAHSDSISDVKYAPGADDNASGIATMTEVLRILVRQDYRPKRTIQFMAYAAEEVGLLGSNEIAKKYKAAKNKVVGVMQLDMTLYKGTDKHDIVLMSDYTNKSQNKFIGNLIDKYVHVPWGYSTCGYGCSDHASWTQAGYPASFPFESQFKDLNPHIHTKNDTLLNAGGDASQAVNFAKLSLGYLIEMSL